jgi:hypothetical protein
MMRCVAPLLTSIVFDFFGKMHVKLECDLGVKFKPERHHPGDPDKTASQRG